MITVLFVRCYVKMPSFCQDRLGTDIQGKLKKECMPFYCKQATPGDTIMERGSWHDELLILSKGEKTVYLSHLYIKTIILPRQARDKHRENSKKRAFSHQELRRPLRPARMGGTARMRWARSGARCSSSAWRNSGRSAVRFC
jgi:hypothetical protein